MPRVKFGSTLFYCQAVLRSFNQLTLKQKHESSLKNMLKYNV